MWSIGDVQGPTGYWDVHGKYRAVVGWHDLTIRRHVHGDDVTGDQYQSLDAEDFVIAILEKDAERVQLERSGTVRVQVVSRREGGGLLIFPGKGCVLPYILLGRKELEDMGRRRQRWEDGWADARAKEQSCGS